MPFMPLEKFPFCPFWDQKNVLQKPETLVAALP